MSWRDNACIRGFVWFVRWLPVCFILAVILWAYYAYVVQLCFNTVERSLERAIYLLFFHIILMLFLWSYYKTVFTPVGKPRKEFYIPAEIRRDLESASDDSECASIIDRYARQNRILLDNRNCDGTIPYCCKCCCIKPDRSHHCSVCGHCVLKFDHHCPWVNTCVNFNNYKFFILFLGYALLLCLFGMITDLQYFVAFWRSDMHANIGFGKFHILFLFFVSGMFAISLCCLFSYHLYLTAHNRSTIETFRPPVFIHGVDKNGYDIGIRRNFEQVFGNKWMLWFLPVFSSCGDGAQYPLNIGAGRPHPTYNFHYSFNHEFCRSGSGMNFTRYTRRGDFRRLIIETDSSDEDSYIV